MVDVNPLTEPFPKTGQEHLGVGAQLLVTRSGVRQPQQAGPKPGEPIIVFCQQVAGFLSNSRKPVINRLIMAAEPLQRTCQSGL